MIKHTRAGRHPSRVYIGLMMTVFIIWFLFFFVLAKRIKKKSNPLF